MRSDPLQELKPVQLFTWFCTPQIIYSWTDLWKALHSVVHICVSSWTDSHDCLSSKCRWCIHAKIKVYSRTRRSNTSSLKSQVAMTSSIVVAPKKSCHDLFDCRRAKKKARWRWRTNFDVPLDNLKVGLSSSTKSSSTGERDLFINAPRSLPRRDAPRMSSSVVRRSAFPGFAFPRRAEQVVWKQSWQMKRLDENHEHPLGYCAMGMTQTMT